MSPAYKLIAFSAVLGVAGHFALADYFHRTAAALPERDRDRLAAIAKYTANAEVARRGEAEKEARQRSEAHHQAIETALGGSYDAVTKDPTLSLSSMLREIARLAAPEGARVAVAVDRFTEFELGFELSAPLNPSDLVPICRPIIERGAPYLSRLSFFADKKLLAELDYQALAGMKPSAPPLDSELEGRLTGSVAGDAATRHPAPPAGKASGAGEVLPGFAGEYRKLVQGWYDEYDAHMRALNEAIHELNAAMTINGLKSKDDLSANFRLAEQARGQIQEAQAFFPGAVSVLEQRLSHTDFDPLLTKITLREANASAAPRLQPLLDLLNRLIRHESNVRQLLQDLRDRLSEWKITPPGKVEFTNQAALAAFQVYAREVNASSREVDAAVGALASKEPPR
jgi:hypothetical protein